MVMERTWWRSGFFILHVHMRNIVDSAGYMDALPESQWKKNVCEKDPDVPTNFHVLGKRLCLSGRSIFTAYWLLMNQNIILYHAYWLGTHISSAPYRLFHPEMAPRHEEWGGAPKLPNSNKTFEFPNGCAMLKEAHSRLLGIVPSPQYETPWNTL